MKIAILSNAASVHTIKWVNGLASCNVKVHLISVHPITVKLDDRVIFHLLPFLAPWGYLASAFTLHKLLVRIKPDLLNAHYATGYGLLARLSCFKPLLLSVWGSDVYDFPFKTPVHKWFVQKNLKAANKVASTSLCMAEQTRGLVGNLRDIAITPFGVDMSAYKNASPVFSRSGRQLVIGTVKTMNPKYGIDTLIKSFAILVDRLALLNLGKRPEITLRLVGGGNQTAELKALAKKLDIADKVAFVGQVPHAKVPHELSKLDIYVALSRLDSESFGVAILEAGAACRPVVVSDAGGLPEVTLDGITGIVVPRDDPAAAAAALERLVMDADLRYRMGQAGRAHVAKHYSWDASIQTMLGVYEQTIQTFKAQNK